MPDLVNRTALEGEMARSLARLGQRQVRLLSDALGDPPDPNKVTPEFWNEFSTEMRADLLPALEDIFLSSAEGMLQDSPIGVDWALVNQQAAQWAETYSYDLVRGITENTRRALQTKVAAFFRQGATLGDLKGSLQSLFGPVRAEMIAATEVTRASVQGELAISKGIAEQGIQMLPVFNTSNDEIVCPLCAPWNQKVVTADKFPPRHPRCRCWLNHIFADAAKGLVWVVSKGLFVPAREAALPVDLWATLKSRGWAS